MILITSADYVDKELQSNFGMLIPSFLPVKNKRLFFYQVNLLNSTGQKEIYLSIPEHYVIDKNDYELLKKLEIKILKVPNPLNLGESILFSFNKVLNESGINEPATILFGDTLINDIPSLDHEFISIAKISQNYKWAKSSLISDNNMTYTGLFNFRDVSLLLEKLNNYSLNFLDAVEEYKKEKGVPLIESQQWYDFGHLSTYYNSRSKLTSERHFNQITAKNPNIIIKSSSQINKIKAEANWFKTIPDTLKIFTPHCGNFSINNDKACYEVEYLFTPVLNELFVFGKLPLFLWKQIITACLNFSERLLDHKADFDLDPNEFGLFFRKTQKRLLELQEQGEIDIYKIWYLNGSKTPSLIEIANQTSFVIDKFDFPTSSIMHGDFCFSNILFDFRSHQIKVIDPRGIDNEGKITIYGDILYDITKLAHSIIGLYDFIIAGYYEMNLEYGNKINFKININDTTKDIQEYFLTTQLNGQTIKPEFYKNQLVHLFLSMLPLHSDNREIQYALLANALRLYHIKF